MTSTNCFKSVFHFQFLLIGLFLIAFSSCEEEDDKVEPASKPNTTAHEAIVLPCNFFETDSVLKNDSLKEVDYIIDCFMQINGDKKVRIEPGVVIEFKQDAGIRVNDNVAFIAEGTEENPIVFSGTGKGMIFSLCAPKPFLRKMSFIKGFDQKTPSKLCIIFL